MVTTLLTMLCLFTVIYFFIFLLIWYSLDCSHPSSHPIATIATDGAAGANAPGNATLVNGRLRRPLLLLYGFISLFVSSFFLFFSWLTSFADSRPAACYPEFVNFSFCSFFIIFLLFCVVIDIWMQVFQYRRNSSRKWNMNQIQIDESILLRTCRAGLSFLIY